MRWLRIGLVGAWCALVLPYLFELLFVVRADHVALLRRLPDDAYYYIEIAARVGRGQGFTFDGIHSTNGFHPLWQLVLVPIVGGLGPGTDAAVRGVLIAGLGCCLGAVVLAVRLVARITGIGPALFGGIVATQFALSPGRPYAPSRWVSGMEAPVVLLAIVLLATALAAADRSRTRGRIFIAGLAAAVVVLARMDFAPLVLVVGAAVTLRWRSWAALRNWTAGLLAIGLPAAAWWLGTWGHVLSTSATVKNAMLHRTAAEQFGGRLTTGYGRFLLDVTGHYLDSMSVWSWLGDHALLRRLHGSQFALVAALGGLTLLVLAVLGWVVALRRAFVRHRTGTMAPPSAAAWAVGVVVGLVLAKAVLDIVSAPLWAAQWYSAPQRLVVGFAVGVGAWLGGGVVVGRSRPVAVVLLTLLILLVLPTNAFAWIDDTRASHSQFWQDQIDVGADWVIEEGPRGVYGAPDAGLLAHRLDGMVPIVNLDGLVNDYEFASLVGSAASLRTRLRAGRVDYLMARLQASDLESIAACSTVLWTSPRAVPYVDALSAYSEEPIRVFDVRACRTAR